jgi:hypothetical protein
MISDDNYKALVIAHKYHIDTKGALMLMRHIVLHGLQPTGVILTHSFARQLRSVGKSGASRPPGPSRSPDSPGRDRARLAAPSPRSLRPAAPGGDVQVWPPGRRHRDPRGTRSPPSGPTGSAIAGQIPRSPHMSAWWPLSADQLVLHTASDRVDRALERPERRISRAARQPRRHCPRQRAWTRPPKPEWRYPDWRHHGERRRVKLSTAEPVKATRLAT